MGTIDKRRRADGTVAYSAQILLMRSGQIVHRESRTFMAGSNSPGGAAALAPSRPTSVRQRQALLAEAGPPGADLRGHRSR